MRVACLLLRMSGYMNSCLRALAQMSNDEVFLSYEQPDVQAPFDQEQFRWLPNRYAYKRSPEKRELLDRLRTFKPDLILVAGWGVAAYRAACREYRHKAVRVLGMDHQWRGTRLKQWLGVATSPIFIQRMFDGAFVPGERTALFANKMGFPQERIWRGYYAGDQARFGSVYKERLTAGKPSSRRFVFVGRLAPEKGIATLADAYRHYQKQTPEPWSLDILGTGPLSYLLKDIDGVRLSGFVQPEALPHALADAGCLIMPSIFEPWCVAIHEACSAGLPVICTSECGACVHLVQDGYNGYVVSTKDAQSLAAAMRRMSSLPSERRMAMSEASYSLSRQFTPERWATCLLERGAEILSTRCSRS